MTDEQKEICHQIALYYGLESQTGKAVEENIELAHALIRFMEGKIPPSSMYELLEEIADVSIMIEQLVFLLDCRSEVKGLIDYKLKRTTDLIEDEWSEILQEAEKEGAEHC